MPHSPATFIAHTNPEKPNHGSSLSLWMPANHKRVYRLYREEGLAMRIRQRRIRWNGVTSPAATRQMNVGPWIS